MFKFRQKRNIWKLFYFHYYIYLLFFFFLGQPRVQSTRGSISVVYEFPLMLKYVGNICVFVCADRYLWKRDAFDFWFRFTFLCVCTTFFFFLFWLINLLIHSQVFRHDYLITHSRDSFYFMYYQNTLTNRTRFAFYKHWIMFVVFLGIFLHVSYLKVNNKHICLYAFLDQLIFDIICGAQKPQIPQIK